MADGFAKKEEAWNNALGQKIGDATVAIVVADSIAKDAALQRTIELLERDNVMFAASTSIIGMDTKLETGISVPVIAVANNAPIVVQKATIDMSLDVSEHAENQTKASLQSETQASTKAGFFGQGVSVRQTVRVGVEHTRKRSSDYSSTMAVHIEMGQAAPPEGLNLLVDGLMECVKQGQSINSELISRQAAAMQEQMEGMDKLPEAPRQEV